MTVVGLLNEDEPERFEVNARIANPATEVGRAKGDAGAGPAGAMRKSSWVEGEISATGRIVFRDLALPSGTEPVTLEVRARRPDGWTLRRELLLDREPQLAGVASMAVNPATGRPLVLDVGTGALYSMDPATGRRALLVRSERDDQPSLRFSSGLAVGPRGEVAYVSASSLDAVLEVDLRTGARSILSGPDAGVGPAFEWPTSIAVDPATGTIFLIDAFERLLRVDPETGDRAVVAEAAEAGEAGVDRFLNVDVDSQTGRVVVLGSSVRASILVSELVAIDPDAGTQTLLAELERTDTSYKIYGDLTVARGFAYLVDQGARSIVEVDLASGRQRELSRFPIADTPIAAGPTSVGASAALDWDEAGEQIWSVGRWRPHPLLRIDPESGDATQVGDAAVGVGMTVAGASIGMASLSSPFRLYALDQFLGVLLRIDLASGAREIVSDELPGLRVFPASGSVRPRPPPALPPAPPSFAFAAPGTFVASGVALFVQLGAVSGAADGALYVAGSGPETLLRIDEATGRVETLSGDDRGEGPAIGYPTDLALDLPGGRALVPNMFGPIGEPLEPGLIVVGLEDGDRRLASSAQQGTGPMFGWPVAVEFDPSTGEAIVADLRALYAVDLASGDRRIFFRPPAPERVPIGPLRDFSYDPESRRLLVLGQAGPAVWEFDLATGQRRILSGTRVRVEESVEPTTGEPVLLNSFKEFGDGPRLAIPLRLIRRPDTGLIYVVDALYGGVLVVEPETGDRQLISR